MKVTAFLRFEFILPSQIESLMNRKGTGITRVVNHES
jgi:hypothetical protein